RSAVSARLHGRSGAALLRRSLGEAAFGGCRCGFEIAAGHGQSGGPRCGRGSRPRSRARRRFWFGRWGGLESRRNRLHDGEAEPEALALVSALSAEALEGQD